MFCQCTISFGKQKLYVRSGFQFSLKNFKDANTYRTDIELCKQKNWLITIESWYQIYQAKQLRVKNYHSFIDGRPW